MTDRHTPGEWRTEKHGHQGDYRVMADMPCENAPGMTLPITVAVASTQGNADFIASAPTLKTELDELVRELTGVLSWAEQCIRDGTEADSFMGQCGDAYALLRRIGGAK